MEHPLVSVGLVEPFPRFAFGEADRADFRFAKNRGRHVAVIDTGRLAAEHRVGEGMPLANGDRRQIDSVGYVADRIDGGDARARVIIDRDAAGLGDLDPSSAKACPSRMATGVRLTRLVTSPTA